MNSNNRTNIKGEKDKDEYEYENEDEVDLYRSLCFWTKPEVIVLCRDRRGIEGFNEVKVESIMKNKDTGKTFGI